MKRWADIRTYVEDLGFLFRNGNCRQKWMGSLNLVRKMTFSVFINGISSPLIWFNSEKYLLFNLFFISLQCLGFNSIFFFLADSGFFSRLIIFQLLQSKCSLWSLDFKQQMDIFSLSAPRGALAIFLKHEFAIILGKCLCMIFIMLKYKNMFSNHE